MNAATRAGPRRWKVTIYYYGWAKGMKNICGKTAVSIMT